MGVLFGTDGVRGVANSELDCKLAFALGQAGAYVLSKETSHKPTIFVGKDTRLSGDMLEAALVAGICSTGAKVVRLGVIPTPAVSFLTRKYKADAGVVISASHNPMEFNGIKFFNSQGFKLNDDIENEIEEIILKKPGSIPCPTGEHVGHVEVLDSAVSEYVEFAASTVWCRFDGMKIALDCANGASYKTSPAAFQKLGAEVLTIHNEPDGTNINRLCGSTHMEDLQKFVVENRCDAGFAFDGDADRMLAVDRDGNLVDGDQIMAICAMELKSKGMLSHNTLVATVMSNLGLFLMGQEQGIEVVASKVGDRYVLEDMLKGGFQLGGEQSGHIIFLQHNTTGDGLISALQLLQVVKTAGKELGELAKIVTILPQALVNARVPNEQKQTFMENAEIAAEIAKLEQKFNGKGRVLIRPSGTEPLVRVMIEGENLAEIQEEAKRLALFIEGKLGGQGV